MGNQSGVANQGYNSIAIGNLAGVLNQSANSIILNASGSVLDAYNPGFFVSPVATHTAANQGSVALLGYGTDGQVVQSGLTVLANGYTGIGTAAFGAYLQVYNSNAAFTAAPTVHIGDGQTDMSGSYGMLQLVRANNGADNKAHLSFIKNGLTVFGMGFYPGASQSTFGLVPSFGSMATNTGIWINNIGSVGIGTTNPSTGLHVNSATAFSGIQLTNTYNGTTGSLGFYIVPSAGGNFINSSTGNAGVILPSDGKDLYIGRTTANNTSLVVQGGTGYVGIGLTNPSATLHVNGSLSCGVISSTTFTITVSSLATALISNISSNGYVNNTVIIITVNGLNLSVGTFGGGTVTASSYVAWSAAQPSYANTYGMVATRGDISITGSGYGVNFNVPSSTFYLSYYVTILRIS
jgi:hypothetical protein